MADYNPAFASYRSAARGEMVAFGTYPQTADGTDQTPIPWRVLQNSGTELFLLSESILDCKQYHGSFVEVTWRECDLRRWLNDTFYRVAFNAAEKDFVKTVYCEDNGAGSPDTEDKVFLLGAAEVKSLTNRHDEEPFVVKRRAIGTDFAKVKKTDGCHLYAYDKSVREDYLTADGMVKGCSWWWLRTQLGDSSRAAFVGPRSSIRSYCRVDRFSYGVRPALKIDLR